jgi:hypothetical protein
MPLRVMPRGTWDCLGTFRLTFNETGYLGDLTTGLQRVVPSEYLGLRGLSMHGLLRK